MLRADLSFHSVSFLIRFTNGIPNKFIPIKGFEGFCFLRIFQHSAFMPLIPIISPISFIPPIPFILFVFLTHPTNETRIEPCALIWIV